MYAIIQNQKTDATKIFDIWLLLNLYQLLFIPYQQSVTYPSISCHLQLLQPFSIVMSGVFLSNFLQPQQNIVKSAKFYSLPLLIYHKFLKYNIL